MAETTIKSMSEDKFRPYFTNWSGLTIPFPDGTELKDGETIVNVRYTEEGGVQIIKSGFVIEPEFTKVVPYIDRLDDETRRFLTWGSDALFLVDYKKTICCECRELLYFHTDEEFKVCTEKKLRRGEMWNRNPLE